MPNPDFLTPDVALQRILDAITPIEAVDVPLLDGAALVLARDVVSRITLPPWANSAMDGYACRSADIASASADTPVSLRVTDEVRAGSVVAGHVAQGCAIRIATGAPVPDSADTIIRLEDTDRGREFVRVFDARDAKRNVRAEGEDIRTGDVAVTAGTRLGAAQLAMCAATGAARVTVHRSPKIAIVSTGDELVSLERFDDVFVGGRIVASNSYGIVGGVRTLGANAVDLGFAPDDPTAIRALLERAQDADLIISTAGVSVGEADHLRAIVRQLRGKVDFWRVQMRPGSPLAFGRIGKTPWLGLPGNPVSALVTFSLFAAPAIRRLMGELAPRPRIARATADETFPSAGSMPHYVRVCLSQDAGVGLRAKLSGPQQSNILSALAKADALAIVPPDRTIEQGEPVDVVLL